MTPKWFSVVDMAREVIQMQRTINDQADEIERLSEYERKYNKLLNESLAHNRKMAGNMLNLLMTPGVVDAATKAIEGAQTK